jgi:hypothetical protein
MIILGSLWVGGARAIAREVMRGAARRPIPATAVAAAVRAYLQLTGPPPPRAECPGIYAAVERGLAAGLRQMAKEPADAR